MSFEQDMLLPIAKIKYVLDSLILSLSIISPRIGKQVIMWEHNKLGLEFAKIILLQLIHNVTKCPYAINTNYLQSIKKDAETFTQCRNKVSCIYHIWQKPHNQTIELKLKFIHLDIGF
jgi:hypothetical protein